MKLQDPAEATGARCRFSSWAGLCSLTHLASLPCRMLLCARQECRPTEWIMQKVLRFSSLFFPTAYSVPVEMVARAMVASVLQPSGEKVEVLENKAIHQRGKAAPQPGT